METNHHNVEEYMSIAPITESPYVTTHTNESINSSGKDERHTVKNISMSDELQHRNAAKESMNRLVLDYLIGKGYQEVAEAFCHESNTEPLVDLLSMKDRSSIQKYILHGQIIEAREKILQMNDSFLSSHQNIDFLLAKQQLIEFIKKREISEALAFATKSLAPFGILNKQYLQEIEHVMSLLAFDDYNQSPMKSLLEQSTRRHVASAVDTTILQSQKQQLEQFLPTMMRQYHYMEYQLAQKINRPIVGFPLPTVTNNEETNGSTE